MWVLTQLLAGDTYYYDIFPSARCGTPRTLQTPWKTPPSEAWMSGRTVWARLHLAIATGTVEPERRSLIGSVGRRLLCPWLDDYGLRELKSAVFRKKVVWLSGLPLGVLCALEAALCVPRPCPASHLCLKPAALRGLSDCARVAKVKQRWQRLGYTMRIFYLFISLLVCWFFLERGALKTKNSWNDEVTIEKGWEKKGRIEDVWGSRWKWKKVKAVFSVKTDGSVGAAVWEAALVTEAIARRMLQVQGHIQYKNTL